MFASKVNFAKNISTTNQIQRWMSIWEIRHFPVTVGSMADPFRYHMTYLFSQFAVMNINKAFTDSSWVSSIKGICFNFSDSSKLWLLDIRKISQGINLILSNTSEIFILRYRLTTVNSVYNQNFGFVRLHNLARNTTFVIWKQSFTISIFLTDKYGKILNDDQFWYCHPSLYWDSI